MDLVGPSHTLHAIPLSALGLWHLDAHRGILSLVSIIAPRPTADFHRTWGLRFQRQLMYKTTQRVCCLACKRQRDLRVFSSSLLPRCYIHKTIGIMPSLHDLVSVLAFQILSISIFLFPFRNRGLKGDANENLFINPLLYNPVFSVAVL